MSRLSTWLRGLRAACRERPSFSGLLDAALREGEGVCLRAEAMERALVAARLEEPCPIGPGISNLSTERTRGI